MAKGKSSEWPVIDRNVKYVGVAHLRKLNAGNLQKLQGALVVQDKDEPLVVILPYETFLRMQATINES